MLMKTCLYSVHKNKLKANKLFIPTFSAAFSHVCYSSPDTDTQSVQNALLKIKSREQSPVKGRLIHTADWNCCFFPYEVKSD
jgi:hypothetical protein